MASEAAVPALRIDLGCGSARRDGFVGLDVFPGPQVDHVIDLTADPFPFPDDSVDEVFSAHFLEHIDSPNHVFGEIGRVCRDGARIEFWTPYAFTNEAFLYGHLHGITEEMWIHLGLTHRDIYAPMLNGRWLLQRFVFVIEPATIADLEHHRVDLDFAVRYLKGVVHEFGVEMEYQSDLEAPPRVPRQGVRHDEVRRASPADDTDPGGCGPPPTGDEARRCTGSAARATGRRFRPRPLSSRLPGTGRGRLPQLRFDHRGRRSRRAMTESFDVAIVGGCGHVGLPLGLAFASRGLRVALYDVNEAAVACVNGGAMPFDEPGAAEVLTAALGNGTLVASCDSRVIGTADHIVIVIGTPIDEHLNPDLNAVPAAIADIADSLVDGQLLVLRGTVYPGVTAMVERRVEQLGLDLDVAFCPERIAEGKAMVELFELPQIVAARSPRALERATKLFRSIAHEIVYLEPEEAELAKLFTNTWRYIKFATCQPAVHDGERLRARLRTHPIGACPRLPACCRPSRRRLRGWALSLQRHDAARGVQQQQLPPRAGERAPSTRVSRSTSWPGSNSATTFAR